MTGLNLLFLRGNIRILFQDFCGAVLFLHPCELLSSLLCPNPEDELKKKRGGNHKKRKLVFTTHSKPE